MFMIMYIHKNKKKVSQGYGCWRSTIYSSIAMKLSLLQVCLEYNSRIGSAQENDLRIAQTHNHLFETWNIWMTRFVAILIRSYIRIYSYGIKNIIQS